MHGRVGGVTELQKTREQGMLGECAWKLGMCARAGGDYVERGACSKKNNERDIKQT